MSAAPLAAEKMAAPSVLAVVFGDDFADTLLLVTIHKAYPAFPESVLHGDEEPVSVAKFVVERIAVAELAVIVKETAVSGVV